MEHGLLYSKMEIEQIARWFQEYGLQLLDLRNRGPRKPGLAKEYARQAAWSLSATDQMAARLGSRTIIMHAPSDSTPEIFRRSLNDLRPFARQHDVRIAIENGDFDKITGLLDEYEPEYLGLCYDSGHANMIPDGLERLARIKHRLISIHLHDNDGASDQHKPLFSGTINWEKLAGIIARSSYKECVSMETAMRKSGFEDEVAFLKHVHETGLRFAKMLK